MRFLMQFKIPHEPFNKLVREGAVSAKLGRIVEETRPSRSTSSSRTDTVQVSPFTR